MKTITELIAGIPQLEADIQLAYKARAFPQLVTAANAFASARFRAAGFILETHPVEPVLAIPFKANGEVDLSVNEDDFTKAMGAVVNLAGLADALGFAPGNAATRPLQFAAFRDEVVRPLALELTAAGVNICR